jgi:hypothetical protein
VGRFALAFVVGLLSLSASGVSSLIVAEPCGYQLTGQAEDDRACPPTCATCGCCAQAAEPAPVAGASSPDSLVSGLLSVLPDLLDADPRDILHVPRAILG